jgi:hypothetical protein
MTWNVAGLPHFEVAGWGGICSHQPNCSRCRRLLAISASDSPVRHRTVSGVPPRHPPVRAWSWSTVGGFVLMWHRTVRCYTGQSGAPLTFYSDIWIALFTLQSRPLRAGSRCSTSALDSPVAHRTVRWIIAKLSLGNPKLKSSRLILPGAPDTVRWCTGQSNAPDQRALRFPLLLSFWTLFNLCIGFELNLWHL